MIGFDERERCYLDDCRHEAACHETHWEARSGDGHAVLVFGACQVDGCPCNEYERNHWTETLGPALPRVRKDEEPSFIVDRRVFCVQWDYKTLAVSDRAIGRLVDGEMSRMGKEGWEIIDSLRAEGVTHYRFKKPLLKGLLQ